MGEFAQQLGISQSTCSHHVRRLTDLGFLSLRKSGTATHVWIDQNCCSDLPHPVDAILGMLAPRPCCPSDIPEDVTIRPMSVADWPAVERIYGEGIAAGSNGTASTIPDRATLEANWFTAHRWVAECRGSVVGWTALAPVSVHPSLSGVAESSICVAADSRGRGVGSALIRQQVIEADRAGFWMLQSCLRTENRSAIALHQAAGYRTVGVRERIAHSSDGWHDALLLERHIDAVSRSGCDHRHSDCPRTTR